MASYGLLMGGLRQLGRRNVANALQLPSTVSNIKNARPIIVNGLRTMASSSDGKNDDPPEPVMAKRNFNIDQRGRPTNTGGPQVANSPDESNKFAILKDAGNPEELIRSLKKSISTHYSVGELDKALEVAKKCSKLVLETFSEDHVVFASCLSDMALMHKELGNLEDAVESYTRALKIYKNQVGVRNPSAATAMTNLGIVYFQKGIQSKGIEKNTVLRHAKDMLVEAISIRREVLDEKDPMTQLSRQQLGLVHHALGEVMDAEELLQDVVVRLEGALGPDHGAVATAKNDFAYVLKCEGKYEQAHAFYLETLRVRESKLGDKHRLTLIVKNNLAELLYAQGDETGANRYHEEMILAVGGEEALREARKPDNTVTKTKLNVTKG